MKRSTKLLAIGAIGIAGVCAGFYFFRCDRQCQIKRALIEYHRKRGGNIDPQGLAINLVSNNFPDSMGRIYANAKYLRFMESYDMAGRAYIAAYGAYASGISLLGKRDTFAYNSYKRDSIRAARCLDSASLYLAIDSTIKVSIKTRRPAFTHTLCTYYAVSTDGRFPNDSMQVCLNDSLKVVWSKK